MGFAPQLHESAGGLPSRRKETSKRRKKEAVLLSNTERPPYETFEENESLELGNNKLFKHSAEALNRQYDIVLNNTRDLQITGNDCNA
ncbi:hypothetical protein Tco_1158189 [Tanacetum coccineum]